jgi:hypothetical protein
MVVLPKISSAVWRGGAAGCVSCVGELELSIKNTGTDGSIRILIEGIGTQMGPKIYDAPFSMTAGRVASWKFKAPYWSNKSPAITIKTGPANSEAWTDQKTVNPA